MTERASPKRHAGPECSRMLQDQRPSLPIKKPHLRGDTGVAHWGFTLGCLLVPTLSSWVGGVVHGKPGQVPQPNLGRCWCTTAAHRA